MIRVDLQTADVRGIAIADVSLGIGIEPSGLVDRRRVVDVMAACSHERLDGEIAMRETHLGKNRNSGLDGPFGRERLFSKSSTIAGLMGLRGDGRSAIGDVSLDTVVGDERFTSDDLRLPHLPGYSARYIYGHPDSAWKDEGFWKSCWRGGKE